MRCSAPRRCQAGTAVSLAFFSGSKAFPPRASQTCSSKRHLPLWGLLARVCTDSWVMAGHLVIVSGHRPRKEAPRREGRVGASPGRPASSRRAVGVLTSPCFSGTVQLSLGKGRGLLQMVSPGHRAGARCSYRQRQVSPCKVLRPKSPALKAAVGRAGQLRWRCCVRWACALAGAASVTISSERCREDGGEAVRGQQSAERFNVFLLKHAV